MNIYVSDLQAALFTTTLNLSNKIGLAGGIIEATKGLFDNSPTMLDVPSDAPADIPRMILKNADSSYMLHFGLNRFDFFYHDRGMVEGLPIKKLEDIKVDYLAKLASVNSSVVKVTGSKIVRLGLIPTLVVKNEAGASNFIRETYFNTEKVNKDVAEINFATNSRGKLDTLKINIGIRGTAFKRKNDVLDNKVSVFNIDINTIPEELLEAQIEGINKFFSSAYTYIEENLASYIC
jgi:hypothetical protein